MLSNVAVAELSKGSMKATSLTSPFAIEGFKDKEDFYKSLAPQKSEQLKELESDTVQSVSSDIQLKIRIGQNLIKAKKLCKHGEFSDWLKACFSWSEDTASRQMRLAEKFESMPGITRFTPTVAYQLSQKSCPDVILEQAIALLDAGEKVTTETVKELKQSVAEETTSLHAVNPKLSKTNNRPEGYIKKGDLVELQYPVKNWNYGRVVSKSSDGIVCKVQSLDGQSLGEKPTKSLTLCPVQKINSNCIGGNVELNQKVIVRPYTTELQPFNGSEGKIIFRDEKRRQFSVQFGDTVKDFHWEEVELIPDEPTAETTIDVEATDITEETEQITPSNIDLKAMSMKQKGQLLKELVEDMKSFNRGLIPKMVSKELEDLVQETLKKMDDLELTQRSREQFVIVFLDKCL